MIALVIKMNTQTQSASAIPVGTVAPGSIPSVEVVMPICPCCYEVGKLQYGLYAEESLKSFLTSHTVSEAIISDTVAVLCDKRISVKACCRTRLQYPQKIVFPKEQTSSSQRVLPTSLPAPLLTGDILEWYKANVGENSHGIE